MATYCISLSRLGRLRDEAAAISRACDRAENPGATSQPSSPKKSAPGSQELLFGASGTSVATPELLNLSEAEITTFFSEMGQTSGKVILGLIHRLAVMEQFLADLGRGVRGGAISPPPIGEIDLEMVASDADVDDNKTLLLSQVFQSNLTLRRM